MPRLTIDNQAAEVPEGATILEAARRLGVEIPALCFLEGHAPNTTCMICLVKADGRWVPSCATVVQEGMQVENETEEVRGLRRIGLELLLSDHQMRCRECERGDECKLRRYARIYGARPARFRGEQRDSGQPTQAGGVIYEPAKCILCGLCVQIANAAAGPLGLTFVGRGFDVRLAAPFDKPVGEGLGQAAAECVSACPTGALSMDKTTGVTISA
jgi:NADP-reducing hydrogenase subunit HndD